MKRKNIFLIFIVFNSILAVLVSSAPRLPEGIHLVNAGQFQTGHTIEEVMTYYDFNRDQSTDLITKSSLLNGTRQSNYLNLYLWNDRLQQFVLQTSFDLSFLSVQSILATSFYDEAIIDLILTYPVQVTILQQTKKLYSSQMIKLICSSKCVFSQSISIPQLANIDLFVPSLITIDNGVGLVFGKSSQIQVLKFHQSSTKYSVTPFLNLTSVKKDGLLAESLSYGDTYYGDYTGDGIADFVISQNGKSLYFFQGDQSGNLHFSKTQQIQYNGLTLEHFSFADINFDGKLDQVLLFQQGLVQIHYHKYPTYELCSQGYNKATQFPYDFTNSTNSYISKIQRFNLTSSTSSRANLLFSDFNNDGYEDFIVDLVNSDKQTHSLLFINVQCTQIDTCGDSTYNRQLLETLTTTELRTFKLQKLPSNGNPTVKMSFLDIYKDGKIDLLTHEIKTTALTPSVNSTKQVLITYFNNQHFDAFFMKITILHGDSPSVDQNINVIGANVNMYITGLSGTFAPKAGNQLTQTGRSLQLPYIFFGLGRTNNYVQDLTVTIPLSPYETKFWSPIIPNSQLIILGPQNGVWALTTIINPTSKMAFVIWLVILALGGIGFAICWLTKKQKQQDKEQLQNFYAILG